MEYTFSNKISALQPSAIREILKATADPAIIPLAAGNPAPDAFPVDEVRAITADILQKTQHRNCQQHEHIKSNET